MDRPKVTIFNTASLDGRLTLAPDTLLFPPNEVWEAAAGSSGELYARAIEISNPQAVMEGSGSLVLDSAVPEPLPPVEQGREDLYQDYLPEEIVHPAGPRVWFAVPDSRGRIRWLYKEYNEGPFAGWYTLVLVAGCTPPEYLAYLRRETIPYLVCGQERVDLDLALQKMRLQLGVTSLLSTAGGRLNGALLRSGLIDEIYIDFFPALIGGKGTPSLFDSTSLKPGELPASLKLISCEPQPNGHVWLHYQVSRE